MSPDIPQHDIAATRPLAMSGRALAGLCLGTALLIVAARLIYFANFGSALPFWDQWDGEGWNLYRPVLQHTMGWSDWFAPHNEHRIAVSRLVSSSMLFANGQQWDSIPLVLFNAVLCGMLFAAIVFFLVRHCESTHAIALACFVGLSALLPTGWENFLFGFQSAFYAMVALAVLTMGYASSQKPGWRYAAVITAATTLSLFTLASGVLGVPAIMLAVALRWRDGQREHAVAFGATLLLLLAVGALGAMLHVHYVGHDFLRAASVGEFLRGFATALSWPLPRLGGAALVVWLPAVMGCVFVLTGRDRRPASRTATVVLVWVALQAAATAYSRGHDLPSLSSRYTDVFMVGIWANVYFLVDLIIAGARRPRFQAPMLAMVCATLGLILLALGANSSLSLSRLEERKQQLNQQRVNVSSYLQTGQPAVLDGKPFLHIPYPDPVRMRMFLDDPTLRPLLRPHLFAPPDAPVAEALAVDPQMGLLSRLSRNVIASRYALGVVALLLLLLGIGAIRPPAATRSADS